MVRIKGGVLEDGWIHEIDNESCERKSLRATTRWELSMMADKRGSVNIVRTRSLVFDYRLLFLGGSGLSDASDLLPTTECQMRCRGRPVVAVMPLSAA